MSPSKSKRVCPVGADPLLITQALLVAVVGVETAVEADHQTAGLCVEAAQAGGGLQNIGCVGEFCLHSVHQGLCLAFTKAVIYVWTKVSWWQIVWTINER